MPASRPNLMLSLADGNMKALQDAFYRQGNSIEQEQFTKLLGQHCPNIAALLASGEREAVEHVFFHVDMNGDGRVSWDDLFDYAVGTANERLQTMPAEKVRSYTFSRTLPRPDNVLHCSYFSEPNLLLLSSRHAPLQMLKPQAFDVVHQLSHADVGGVNVLPVCSAYMTVNETLAVCFSDLRLRLWSAVDHTVPSAAKPLHLEHMMTRLRPMPLTSPYFLMASDTSGSLLTIEASKQALAEPRLRSSVTVHSRNAGGVSDFCFLKPSEARVATAGYDKTLCWTDLVTHRSTLVGPTSSVLRKLEYFDGYGCLVAAGHDHMITTWVTHQSQKPCTPFEDPSRPHQHKVIGLEVVPHSPQVLSCDASGMIKVWDVRRFRCVQTFYAVEGFNAEAENGLCSPLDDDNYATSVNAFCYVEATREVCSVSSSGAHFHVYNKGNQPQLASQHAVNAVRYNPLHHSLLTASASAVQVWDADLGHLQSELAKNTKDDITTLSVDGVGRRMMLGTQSGEVEIRSCDGGGTLELHKLHRGEVTGIDYSLQHRAMVSSGMDGTLCVVMDAETNGSAAVHKVKLSSKPIMSLGLSQELSLVAAGGKNGTLYLLDVVPPRNEETELQHPSASSVQCTSFMGGFPLVASGHANGDILFWSVRPSKEEMLILGMNINAQCTVEVSVSPGKHADSDCTAVPATGGCLTPSAHVASKVKRHESSEQLHATAIGGITGRDASAQQRATEALATSLLAASWLPQSSPVGAASSTIMTSSMRCDDVGAGVAEVYPTCLAFDPKTHHLLIATNKGRVHIWRCCPLLQALGLQVSAYPQTLPFSIKDSLEHIRRNSTSMSTGASYAFPTALVSIHAHSGEVIDLQMIQKLDLFATCGDDHRVLLFDTDGNKLSELSQGRIPPSLSSLDWLEDSVLSGSIGRASTTEQHRAVQSSHDNSSKSAVVRRSRRPTVDRMLQAAHASSAQPQPYDYRQFDGHTITDYNIQPDSPHRHGVASSATPMSVMKRRKAARDAQSNLLLGGQRAVPLGSECDHVIASSLMPSMGAPPLDADMLLNVDSVPQRKHKTPSHSRPPSALLIQSGGGPGTRLPTLLPLTALLGTESATTQPDDTASSDSDLAHPDMIGNTVTTSGSQTFTVTAGAFMLGDKAQKFSPRLKPVHTSSVCDAEGNALSNQRHLVTLLRSLGDFSEDWLTPKKKNLMASRQKELEAARLQQLLDEQNEIAAGKAAIESRIAKPPRCAPHVSDRDPAQATKDPAPPQPAANLCIQNSIVAAPEIDHIGEQVCWGLDSNGAVIATARTQPIRDAIGDVNLPPPSDPTAPQDPAVQHRQQPAGIRRVSAKRDVSSAGAGVPPLRAERRLSVPDTATPLEALKLLHAAWTMAHESGGTALHYLGAASNTESKQRPNTTESVFSNIDRHSLRHGSAQTSGGSPRRFGSSGGVRVGIARLVQCAAPCSRESTASENGPLVLRNGVSEALGREAVASAEEVGCPNRQLLLLPRPSGCRPATGGSTLLPDVKQVGIHQTLSPRALSGNAYTARVRHGHAPVGLPTRTPRPPPRQDARSVRIAHLQDELKRCLVRQRTDANETSPRRQEVDLLQF